MRRTLVLPFACASLIACGDAQPDDPLTPAAPLPTASGTCAGTYRVPTTSQELVAAASFSVDSVDWEVAGNEVSLHYNLPEGLVGGRISVALRGTLAPGATEVDLTGEQGSGHCVATATTVTCREDLTGLGTLPISADVVTQVAMREFTGPVSLRTQVSSLFSSDPIGIVELDLTTPVVDDHVRPN